MPTILIVVATGLGSWALAHLVRLLALRIQLLDVPNVRSSHVQPTPRLGGIAMAVAAICGYAVGLALGISDPRSTWVWTGAAVAGAVGLVDDVYGLRPGLKMLGQVMAASGALYFGVAVLAVDSRSACFAGFTMVAFANVFNFMDGSDGLAAGMAGLFATGLATLTVNQPGHDVIFSAGLTMASAVGFLILNWSRASIFMGDTGSLFLGFLLAALSWQVIAIGVAPVAVGLVFLPFIGDGGWTLLRRARRRERLWEAHRSHMYQRLLVAGWSHSSVALIYYAWAIAAVTLATGGNQDSFALQAFMMLLGLGSIIGMELFVRANERGAAFTTPTSVAPVQDPSIMSSTRVEV